MTGSARAFVLVLDGLGVGNMEGASTPNTLASIARVAGKPHLPNLAKMGLLRLLGDPAPGIPREAGAAWGKSRIAHPGADTYLGHQEMMGTIPPAPERPVMDEVGDALIASLGKVGIAAHWRHLSGTGSVLVSDNAVIADNIEAARGLNINVTGSLDEMSFEQIEQIGLAVRDATRVTRVIPVGGRGYTLADILGHVRRHPDGHVGVDTPSLGVYDENYIVRHLGFPVATDRQAPSLARAAGLQVALIGKAADVLACPDPTLSNNAIDTEEVFRLARGALEGFTGGLIIANVQETDLAGHEQDSHRYRRVLELVDHELESVSKLLTRADLLLITADHGNDPSIGTSQHTREFVPILLSGACIQPGPLSTRATLADVGATVCAWLDLDPPADGTPIMTPDTSPAGRNLTERGHK